MTVLNKEPFYHKSIRNITSAFGTIFNNIKIVRKNSSDVEQGRYLVPLFYGDKNAWYKRMQSKVNDFDAGSNQTINIGSILPVMSFKLLSMAYAPGRKVNTLNNIACNIPGDEGSVQKSFAPVPYDFDFQLQIFTKNTEDGLQMIEQIIPFFQPSVNIKLKERDDPEVYNDIQIVLSSVTPEDDNSEWEGGRLITWTLDFVVTGNVYPPSTLSQLILGNQVDVNDLNNNNANLSTVVVNAQDLNLDFTETFNSQIIPLIT